VSGDVGWDRDSLAQALVLTHRYTVHLTRVVSATLGLPEPENRDVQTVLVIHDAGPLTPSGLATAIGTPRSTLSRAVSRLEALGLVSRRHDDADQRRVFIDVTAKGRRRVARARALLDDLHRAGDVAVKHAIDLLDRAGLSPAPEGLRDPIDANVALATVGDAYVTDVVRALEPYGVSEGTDRFALALLDLNAPMRPSQLSDELGITPGGVSGLLTRLEAERLLVRGHDHVPGDRRAVTVVLTDRGREAAAVQLDVFARHAADVFRAMAATAPREG
jgi:DNA-binding MarR family transcriptional regulator